MEERRTADREEYAGRRYMQAGGMCRQEELQAGGICRQEKYEEGGMND